MKVAVAILISLCPVVVIARRKTSEPIHEEAQKVGKSMTFEKTPGAADILEQDATSSSAWKYLAATIGGAFFATCAVLLEGAKKRKGEMTQEQKLVQRKELQDLIPKRRPSTPTLKESACPSPTSSTVASPTGDAGSCSPFGMPKAQAWVPGKALSNEAKVERQIKSILNKLTRENYGKLYAQLLESGISQQSHIECLARDVFMKATADHHQFVEMYADLCRDLHESLENEKLQDANAEINFKKVLLDQCQEAFALYGQLPAVDESHSYDEKYEEWVKYKTKMIGNIRLVGHLLVRKMVSPKIIFLCSEELIKSGTEEALETLSVLLETIGPTFDTPAWVGSSKLQEIFSLVKIMSDDEGQSARIRCLLQDVLDKRANDWKEVAQRQPKLMDRGSKTHKDEVAHKNADTDSCWRRSGDLMASKSPHDDRSKWRTIVSAAAHV
jgi:translation initiation factor 4G